MDPILFILSGVLLLVLAGALYIRWNPSVLTTIARRSESLRQAIEAEREGQDAASIDADAIVRDTERSADERLEYLGPGHFIEVLNGEGLMEELQVQGVLALAELRERGGPKQWQKSGARYPALYLEGDRLLVRIAAQWYYFDTRKTLSRDGVELFRKPGQDFGATHQIGVVEFEYDSTTWQCTDIGRYEAGVRGRAHLTDGESVMFLLSTCGDRVLFVENAKVGNDYVWFGKQIDPTQFITRIL